MSFPLNAALPILEDCILFVLIPFTFLSMFSMVFSLSQVAFILLIKFLSCSVRGLGHEHAE